MVEFVLVFGAGFCNLVASAKYTAQPRKFAVWDSPQLQHFGGFSLVLVQFEAE